MTVPWSFQFRLGLFKVCLIKIRYLQLLEHLASFCRLHILPWIVCLSPKQAKVSSKCHSCLNHSNWAVVRLTSKLWKSPHEPQKVRSLRWDPDVMASFSRGHIPFYCMTSTNQLLEFLPSWWKQYFFFWILESVLKNWSKNALFLLKCWK